MSTEAHTAKKQGLQAQSARKSDSMNDLNQIGSLKTPDDETPSAPPGLLKSQIHELLDFDTDLAHSSLKLLDCYLSMWDCYVVKSAEIIQLEKQNGRLQKLNESLAGECDAFLQGLKEQSLVLHDRRQAVRALQNGVIATLHASDPQPF
ncbi:hypothetical protein N7540_011177 [Penicillium herquei]|nr:hypothetical protein N7540_011177 [Penicillium herquei]